jgi:acyl transferase domain-containing protein/NADPH:quinone reductase-like Zn-dependent oxidoreductase/acyl carrier protein
MSRRSRHGAASAPIAIVGAACRFPGAPDLDAYWRLLVEGRDAVTAVPADRFTQGAFLHPRRGEPGRTFGFPAGVLPDVADFDPGAFGISPREAAEMDPQQRLLLEVAAEALDDAGLPPSRLAGSGAGVFVGASLTDYADLRQADPASGDRYFMTGGALSILANRVGNAFDLRGPAQVVDTACSSSLVALHWAAEALRAGKLPAAVVGGVNLLLSPYPFLGFSRAGMLSPSGRCRAFDAAGDGYVRAEGAGVVVLKPLPDALRDGDPVRAVLLATGANAAGRTVGLSLPNAAAQTALLRRAMAEAGVAPERIGYFEAHGTGTAAGDPVEAAALGEAIGRHRRDAPPLPVGSAKTNIGHAEPASGMAGLLKAVLVLEHGRVPPSLHFETPNPAIDFAALGLRVPTAPQPLPRRGGRGGAVVGVNSFGFGGTNATALLAAAPPRRRAAAEEPAGAETPPLLLSAHSAPALGALAARWQSLLADTPAPALPALLRGAARHRDMLPHRLAVRGGTGAELLGALAAWRAGAEGAAVSGEAGPGGRRVAFVFSGNGAQWAGMGRNALAASAAFRAGVSEADAALAPHLGWSVAEALAAGVPDAALAATDRAQPLLFAVQHGIAAALAAEGIRPDLCLGHSVGEVAAAAASGLLGLADAARLICARSRHQQRTRGAGRMAAVGASAEEALPVLAACGAEAGRGLEIAAVNAPVSVTVAGPASLLRRLAEAAAARRWAFLELDLDYAFHSAAMDTVRDGLLAELDGLPAAPPRVPLVSTVTGEPLDAVDCAPAYWWRNLREAVAFLPAVRRAAADGPTLFLEIGPNPVLQGYLRDALRGGGGTGAEAAAVLPTLARRDGPGDPFPAIADRAFAGGADPRGAPAFAGPAARRGLPPTPFARKRVWHPASAEARRLTDPVAEHPLLGFRDGAEPGRWTRLLDTALEPWLADHRLLGRPVLPAAAMLEMALAAGNARHPDAPALEVRDFAIHHALPLEAEHSRELRVELDAGGAFALSSRPRLSDEPWTLHAAGRVAPLPRLPEPPPGGASTVEGRAVPREALLAAAAAGGLDYGPAFRSVDALAADPAAGSARVSLRRPPTAPPDAGFLLHPSLLDGALQGLIGLLADGAEAEGAGLVPVRFARLAWRRGATGAASGARLRLSARGERSAAADLVLHDAAGEPMAVVEGAWLQRVRLPGGADAAAAFRVDLVPALPGPNAEAPDDPDLGPVLDAARRRDAALDLGEASLLLEGFCAAAAHAALAAAAPAAPAPGDLARALFRSLEVDGLAASGPAGPRLLPAPADLPDALDIWRQVLLEQPALAPDLAWLALAAERLPGALAGERPSTAGGAGMEDAVSSGPPPGSAALARLAAVLAEAASAFAAAWPRGRPLRVLEIGAGAGPLTARLAAVLADSGLRVLLHAAALPGRGGGAARLPSDTPASIEFIPAVWDPLGPEPPPVAADLVVGLGAGAFLRAGAALPSALRQAVAPGGALLLAEPLPGRVWDFCCGQDAAWWGAPGGSALPDSAGWAEALRAAGWDAPPPCPLAAAPWPAALVAARAPAGAAVLAAPTLRRVALFAEADAAALRDRLAATLQARGAAVSNGDLADAASVPPAALRGSLVVALATGEAASAEALGGSMAAVSRLASAAEGVAAGFRLVTLGGQQPPDGADPARHLPDGAARFALGRVLANEHPALRLRRIDICPSLSPEAAARRLAPELLHDSDGEAEVALTPGGRRVPRLRPHLPPRPAPSGPSSLAVRHPGQLDSLRWRPFEPRQPGPGEVLLRVEAAGINFRDVMWAQGLLPEEALLHGFTGPGLGMECAGVVEAAGEGVPFRPGDRVFGVAPRALATHALTRAEALAPVPPGLDPEAAATVPVAFLTAVHALEDLARLEAGERVLIHGGAGAVGLAALQVALAAGASVAATAGTAAKRAFLRAAGAELALDSRDPGFADALRAEWPEGVDVVLNSLAGDAMERSLGLLRPFGRFVELGKRDFAEARRVSLRPLRRNAGFFAVDVDELPRARPAVAARLLSKVARRLEEGTLRPLPATLHAPAEAEAAFRTLQAGGHIGKLVLRPPAAAAAAEGAICPKPPLAQAAEGTVVVVGGTAGFGLAAARALAKAGVRHLALLSRRGAETPGADAALRDLAALGATAAARSCDAADPAALARALDAVRAAMPPIRGVVHAAAVLEDGAAASLDPRRAARVLAAKLTVAENLDRLTATDPLALFVLFSSATVPVGSPGQAAYVSANAALEALARRRRAAGRPALAVQWGPIADAGMLAGDAGRAAGLRRRFGAAPMRAAEALAALPALLDSGLPCAGLASMAWGEAGAALPVLAEPAFEAVRGAAAAAAPEDLRARLRDAPPEEALDLLRATLAAELARILRLPNGAVPAEAPLAGLGLDSLGGMELRAALEARLGMAVPLAAVTETLTIDGLARRIAEAVRAAPAEAEAAALLAAHEPPPPAASGNDEADTMGAAA